MGSFPHFDQFGYENQKGEGGKGKREKEGKKTDRERKKGGEKKGYFPSVSTVESRRSES